MAVNETSPVAAQRRNGGIDVLRAALTLLVVMHHAAITYGADGSWFYQEVGSGMAPSSLVLTVFCAVNQAYFMGLFFLLAGAFTPGSLARHGLSGFALERLKRLGLPLLAFVLVIGPVTVALARTGKGEAFLDTLAALAERRAIIVGPLWFALALLIFSLLFGLWYALGDGAQAASRVRPFPSNRSLALAALLVGAVTFALRLVWPVGTSLLGLQFGYFPGYVVLFLAGCFGAAGHWIERIPIDRLGVWVPVTVVAIPVAPVMLLTGLQGLTASSVPLTASSLPFLQGSPDGGWNVPAAVYAFWEPLVAWGLILGLLWLFQRSFASPGRLWRTLARRAFLIYVIHPLVLVAVALALRPVAAPPLVKFAMVGPMACLLCYGSAGLLLRVPVLQRIF